MHTFLLTLLVEHGYVLQIITAMSEESQSSAVTADVAICTDDASEMVCIYSFVKLVH